MTREEWRRAVDWRLAVGLPVKEAIAGADHQRKTEELVRQAEAERFNEYGMPR